MLSLKLRSPGPFWLEDLTYLVADNVRRVPEHTARAVAHWTRIVGHVRDFRNACDAQLRAMAQFSPETLIARALRRQPPKAAIQALAPELDEPLEWSLATRALAEGHEGAEAVAHFHSEAGKQLDSATYVLARLRDELRPLMRNVQLPGDGPVALHGSAAFETSLDALLALSRENAATRPKERALTAA